MARKETLITEHGIKFINHVCNKEGNSLISGTNGTLPYAITRNGQPIDKTWTSNAKINNAPIT